MKRHVLHIAFHATLGFFGVAGCSELSTPADLDHEQIIGVRATPPALASGSSVFIDTLIAGPEGQLLPPSSWRILGDQAELQLIEETGGVRLYYDDSSTPRQEVQIELSVALPNGEELLARKFISIESSPVKNPQITSIVVAGEAINDGQDFITSLGDVTIEVIAPDASNVSWYTSLGEIRYYRDAITSMTIEAADGTSGWVAAVIRDDQGGVDWQSFNIRIE